MVLTWSAILEWMHSEDSGNDSGATSEFFERPKLGYCFHFDDCRECHVPITLKISDPGLWGGPGNSKLYGSFQIANFWKFSYLFFQKFMRSSDCAEIDDLLNRLEMVSKIGEIFNRSTNTMFLYFHRSLAQVYFESAFDEFSLERVEYFIECLEDGANFVKAAKHCAVEDLREAFREEMHLLIQEVRFISVEETFNEAYF